MDKRTILAVVLMVIIITVGFSIQGLFTSPKPETSKSADASPKTTASTAVPTATTAPIAPLSATNAQPGVQGAGSGLIDPSQPADALIPVAEAGIASEPYIYDNGKLKVIIDPKGANVTSIKLKDYKDGADFVEMIVPGKEAGLVTRIGGLKGEILSHPFKRASTSDRNVFEFYREFQVNNASGKVFRITKRYTFYPDEYLFQLDIGMQNSANEPVPLGKDKVAYTLSLGPQIGPLTSNFTQYQDFRRLVYLDGQERKQEQPGQRSGFDIPKRVSWAAIEGKYFAFFLIPGAADFKISYGTPDQENGKLGSTLGLVRPAIEASAVVDSYRIYVGPKLSTQLDNYNQTADNKAGQSGLNLDKVVDNGWLWWLEAPLKWLMQLFYMVIPNWGIAIILVTILVKLLMYPLTKKSMESTSRMQALNPQITELREKYKDNPQKLNAETAELYKREKINPLGGCLPILLQFPFFFAMYNIFYNYFDMRGSMFIPGWISDLSVPETVIHFAYNLPFIGMITGLHLLPFIYLGSQFLSTKITTAQSAGAGSTGQMKFMMYGLPAIFFFILYETPSGLLVYWIFQNILSIGQQQLVNRHLKRIQASQVKEEPRKIIKPGQAGKSASIIKGKNGPKKTK